MQKVYPADVTLAFPERKATGRPCQHPVPSLASVAAAELIEDRPAASVPSRGVTGTKGPLQAAFAAIRIRVADGPVAAKGQHLPGEEAWLIGEHRAAASGSPTTWPIHPANTPLEVLAALIKRHWVCEQMHQQMKDELGLDHFEGRSWRGLHHHGLLCQLAFAFLQHLRLGRQPARARTAAGPEPAGDPPAIVAALTRRLLCCRIAGTVSRITSGYERGRVAASKRRRLEAVPALPDRLTPMASQGCASRTG